MNSPLERERAEQRRWRLRPGVPRPEIFSWLLENEFSSPQLQRRRADARLRQIVEYAAAHVPYYRALFARLGLEPSSIAGAADLARLPILTRADVQEKSGELRAARMPPGHVSGGTSKTSGTTGQPVAVRHTLLSRQMFHFLKQREFRWWRVDPMLKLAWIRPASDLPYAGPGRLPDGATVEQRSWPPVGSFFFTGPFVGFNNTNPVEARLDWLDRQRPGYLLSLAADLEHLALACRHRTAPGSLKSLHSVSQQLTPAMRELVEGAFGVPVHENYGLNEIGIVASRCPESGWFHVHAEHCLVEIVDEDGQPLPDGRAGRLVVTGLSNPAMPLIRYDADDLAELADEPCPCGRTLPSIRKLRGRYRRVAHLPPGTWTYWDCVVHFFGNADRGLLEPMQQYQLHQRRDGGFELRLKVTRALSDALLAQLRAAWDRAGAGRPAPLAVMQVDRIAAQGAKFQNFTSEFAPPEET